MEDIRQRITRIFKDGFLALALSIGSNLKIFDAISDAGNAESPATAEAIAEKAGLKGRYVKEWLGVMVCGNFVEVDESGKRFWIKDEYRNVLSGPNAFFMLEETNILRNFGNIASKIEEVFKKNGPLGMDWNDYGGLQQYIDLLTRGIWGDSYAHKLIELTGYKEKLEAANLEVLDIGCGSGYHETTLAKAFPKMRFTAIDLSKEAIVNAKDRQRRENLNNVDFIEMNGQQLPKEWTNRFDWIMMFDCCHDQVRPDLSLKEIHRALKDDGIFTMIDIDGTGDIYQDKMIDGDEALLSYLFSVFLCLPCASNEPGALCLGTKWGRPRAIKLLEDCGFKNIRMQKITFTWEEVMYVCNK